MPQHPADPRLRGIRLGAHRRHRVRRTANLSSAGPQRQLAPPQGRRGRQAGADHLGCLSRVRLRVQRRPVRPSLPADLGRLDRLPHHPGQAGGRRPNPPRSREARGRLRSTGRGVPCRTGAQEDARARRGHLPPEQGRPRDLDRRGAFWCRPCSPGACSSTAPRSTPTTSTECCSTTSPSGARSSPSCSPGGACSAARRFSATSSHQRRPRWPNDAADGRRLGAADVQPLRSPASFRHARRKALGNTRGRAAEKEGNSGIWLPAARGSRPSHEGASWHRRPSGTRCASRKRPGLAVLRGGPHTG